MGVQTVYIMIQDKKNVGKKKDFHKNISYVALKAILILFLSRGVHSSDFAHS